VSDRYRVIAAVRYEFAVIGRCVIACALVVSAFALAGVAAGSPAPRPVASAPSEYVEVVPTAGGGAPAGSGSRRGVPPAGSSSALGAAADAIGGDDERRLIGLGVVLLGTTLALVAAALRQVPNG
jgi:hypothetical protein